MKTSNVKDIIWDGYHVNYCVITMGKRRYSQVVRVRCMAEGELITLRIKKNGLAKMMERELDKEFGYNIARTWKDYTINAIESIGYSLQGKRPYEIFN